MRWSNARRQETRGRPSAIRGARALQMIGSACAVPERNWTELNSGLIV